MASSSIWFATNYRVSFFRNQIIPCYAPAPHLHPPVGGSALSLSSLNTKLVSVTLFPFVGQDSYGYKFKPTASAELLRLLHSAALNVLLLIKGLTQSSDTPFHIVSDGRKKIKARICYLLHNLI